jgi:hypothetical protein
MHELASSEVQVSVDDWPGSMSTELSFIFTSGGVLVVSVLVPPILVPPVPEEELPAPVTGPLLAEQAARSRRSATVGRARSARYCLRVFIQSRS